jgi:hypothetical protein
MKQATYWDVLKECFWRPHMLLANGLYAAINGLLFLRDNLLPDTWKSRLTLLARIK